MTRLAGVCALLVGAITTACTSGDDGSSNPNPTGRSCTAQLTLAGTFAADASAPVPSGYNGCWPAGTWTFTATVGQNTCASPPTLLSSYVFLGQQELDNNGDPIVDKFSLVTPDPASLRNIVKVSELGSAMCEGEVEP
jgi:hypothetical protein